MFAVTVSGHEAFKWWLFLDRRGNETENEQACRFKEVNQSVNSRISRNKESAFSCKIPMNYEQTRELVMQSRQ
jgi:hypothetical protein